jgi:hypothetical protein
MELGDAYSSDPKIRLFSVQHNGQFLFVSNDFENGDRVVEAHPFPNEERNFFRALEDPDDRVRLFHPSTGTFVFVSNDLADTTSSDTDRIVEAHANPDEERNRFEVQRRTMEASSSSTPTPKDSCFYPTTNEATTS